MAEGSDGRNHAYVDTGSSGAIHANAALLTFLGRVPLTGGLPLLVGEEIVGDVGSSRGEPADDLAVCHAVCAALRQLPLAG